MKMSSICFKNYSYFLALLLTFSLQAQEKDSIQLLWSAEIHFDFAKHDLRAGTDTVLQKIIALQAEKSLESIKITAHTDAIGSNSSNLELARKRGASVRNFLVDGGFEENLLQITPFGEEQPVANNDSETNRQLNRRVTIDVFERIVLQPQTPMTKVSGQVKDKDTGEGIEASVIIHSKDLRDSFLTDPNGFFERNVPENIVIGIDIYAKGHFYDTRMLKTKTGQMPQLSFKLTEVKAGATVDIKNLYFVGNQPVLLKRSLPERPKILRFMQLNDSIRIEIAGHVNHPGVRPEFLPRKSLQLSVNRARNIYDYLLRNGIPKSRMTYKGYGNSQMRFPRPKSFQEQELNRRVEIKVLGTDKVLSAEEPLPNKR